MCCRFESCLTHLIYILRSEGVIVMSTKPEQIHEVLQGIENTYDYVNCGGCGVIASSVGQILSTITEVRIVVGAYDYNVKKQALSFLEIKQQLMDNLITNPSINDWEYLGVSFNHVWVEFLWEGEWYSMDTENIKQGTKHFHGRWDAYTEYLSIKDITQLSNNTDGWNCMFDRDQIPSIKHDLETKLQQVCS